ncbi:hypothetical protein JVU11DRAFT_6759 [Chiua virens]|nr:hypothetical protein JVU11DRAFT_6759 [Chiua virens]
MVLFLFVLDTFQSISAIYMAYYYTVKNYCNPDALAFGIWPYGFTPLGTALAAFVTQIYLGFRIWRLAGNKLLSAVVPILAIPSLVMGVTVGIQAIVIGVIAKMERLTPLVTAWLSLQVITDAYITITLVIIFVRWRGGFRKTDTILNRLIRGAIQTGLLAGIFSICDLAAFVALPRMYLYSTFAIPIGRIYTNTLMDTLLTRQRIRADMVSTYEMNRVTAPIAWLPADTNALHTIQLKTIEETSECSPDDREEGKVVPWGSACETMSEPHATKSLDSTQK